MEVGVACVLHNSVHMAVLYSSTQGGDPLTALFQRKSRQLFLDAQHVYTVPFVVLFKDNLQMECFDMFDMTFNVIICI